MVTTHSRIRESVLMVLVFFQVMGFPLSWKNLAGGGVLKWVEVAKWQDWDAMDGRNGGAQQAVWEILMEMERFNGKAKEEDQGALAMVLSWRRHSSVLASLWLGLGDAFQLAKEDPASAVRVLRAPEACTVRRMCGRAAHEITAILPGSKWSCLLLRTVLQDALSEVTKITLR